MEFSRQSSIPLKLCAKCKSCYRSYYARNAERIRANSRDHYQRNKEKLIAQNKSYRAAHPERLAIWRANDYKRQRARTLMECFGITMEQRAKMFHEQQGKCAICKRDESKFVKSLAVDHDHKTGIVRGLLCGSCNRALGYFQESEENLREAIEYLSRAKVRLPS